MTECRAGEYRETEWNGHGYLTMASQKQLCEYERNIKQMVMKLHKIIPIIVLNEILHICLHGSPTTATTLTGIFLQENLDTNILYKHLLTTGR